MKTTLHSITFVLLSILFTMVFSSCTQAEENKEIAEIQESIEQTKESEAMKRVYEQIALNKAKFQERKKKNLEKMVSTPEGRAEMQKFLIRWRYTYVENQHLVFKLNETEAINAGLSKDEYNDIVQGYEIINHRKDSLMALRSETFNYSCDFKQYIEIGEAIRNGTHDIQMYLKKYNAENPTIPSLKER